MLSEKNINRILAAALEGGADFAEIFYEDTKRNSISLENSKLERVKTGYDLGVGVRVITGDQVSYAYTDDLSMDSLLQTAKVAGSASQGNGGVAVADLTKQQPQLVHPVNIKPTTVDKKRKVQLVQDANQAARGYNDNIRQVMVSYSDKNQRIMVANSEGLLIKDERTYSRMRVQAVASDGSQMQTGSENPGRQMGFELFEKYPPEKIGEEAARQAITMLEADPAPSGKMPVVINNGFGGVLFHEACGHGLEADAVQKGASVFADKVGEQVASELVTAVDDATVRNAWGSFGIDSEGEQAQRTVLIKDGILQDYMYDKKSARKEGRKSTGNGRRTSYRSLPIPRMTNTFIEKGDSTPEEIIGAVDDGFYAKKLSGGQVEPTTGEFVFNVSEGYMIENGSIAKPVRGATLVGRGIDVLKKVSMVGNDLELAPGMCGKQGQSVPAGVGQPTLLIDEITVGGTERKGE